MSITAKQKDDIKSLSGLIKENIPHLSIYEAVRQATMIVEAQHRMKTGLVELVYTKSDGSTCTRLGTLHFDKVGYLPALDGSVEFPNGILKYYDLRNGSYVIRSFHIENLKSAKLLYNLDNLE